MKKILIGFLGLLGLLAAYLLLWPVPIDPGTWTPLPAPDLSGDYAPNDRLAGIERLYEEGVGSEDVAVAADGSMYLGLADGRIGHLDPSGTRFKEVAQTGGRPLGLHMDEARGRLIIADAFKGLLSLDLESGALTTLTDHHGDKPFRFTDDVDVAADGTIYFSDASHKFQITNFRAAVFEHQPNGRLLAYTPQGETKLLADNLYFANGVALAHDESYVLVAETTRYRIQRYWLTGERAGTLEMFVENLPGFPDGVSRGSAGRFWVAMFTIRNPIMDKVLPTPWIRKLLIRLPEALQPQAAPHGFVLGFDGDANVVANLQDRSADAFFPVTSVQERLGKLHLGSLQDNGIGRMAVP